MIGPKKTPKDFGFKPGDHHLIVNDITETVKAFDFEGKLLWELPCLARGQGSDSEFKLTNTDTPPGLYRIGAVYRDYDRKGDDGKKADIMFGILKLEDGKLSGSRMPISINSNYFQLNPAKPGYVTIVEYFKKKKTISFRIEKLVY
jgi:hypothetical protein